MSLALGLMPQTLLSQESPPETGAEFHVGPLIVRPYFRITRLGYDTNVFNSATDPVSDFVAQGGPGINTLLPLGELFELSGGGSGTYRYYKDTAGQRGWSGNVYGGAALHGNRTILQARYDYSEQFARPDFEIDDRLNRTTSGGTTEWIQKLWSRWGLTTQFEIIRTRFGEGVTSGGADPATNRNQDRYRLTLEPRYALTEKTDLLLGADQEWHRFETNSGRDSVSNRAWLGLRVSSTTRFFGTGRGGLRYFSFRNLKSRGTFPYADVILGYVYGPRTMLTASYRLDRNFTFASSLGELPTARREVVVAQVDKGLWGNLELRLIGRLRRYRTDDQVRVVVDGMEIIARREDEPRDIAVNPAFRIKRLFRFGVEARYIDRRSNIPGLSVSYWQYGATFEVVPATFQ